MPLSISRRHLLAATAGTLGAMAAGRPRPALAEAQPLVLTADRRTLEVNGRAASLYGITQADGTHGLITEMGTPFRLTLRNGAAAETLIHWHGLTPPYQQDGVPGISAPALPPGGTAQYDFPLAFSGTFWMHSHQGLQEQALMTAPLIIRPRGGMPDRQEIVLMLHDFSFRSPEEIYAGLRRVTSSPTGRSMDKMAGMAGNHMQGMRMGGGDMKGMAGMPGMAMGTPAGQAADAGASGMEMDLNDVVYDAFLANDRTLADPQVIRVEPGARLLLRVINGSAASNFQIDLGQVRARLVAVDGHGIQALRASVFPIAMAQRLDLELEMPAGQSVLPVLAVLEGERKRTGIVLATARGRVAKLGALASSAATPLNFAMEETLRAVTPLAMRPATRTIPIDLTGAMQGYSWGLNGLTYGHDKPLMVAKGERVEIAMTNRTMMSHPMHLHGHVFQVVGVDGTRFPGAMRDTVLVPPMRTVTIAFDAGNPGRWAFHCHNLYHMEAGMMTTVQYESF